MDPQYSDVHVGIDGGQNMLKLGVTITNKEDSDETGGYRIHSSSQYKNV